MSYDGERWTETDGTTHTVNSTDDPNVGSGGYYHSQSDSDGGHATAVYESDGSFADVSANDAWE